MKNKLKNQKANSKTKISKMNKKHSDILQPLTEGVVTLYHNNNKNNYLEGMLFNEYLEHIKNNAIDLYKKIDFADEERLNNWLARMQKSCTGFSTKGGRGAAYRAGQKRNPLARKNGVRDLFKIVEQDSPKSVLDALGGSGTMSRVRSLLEDEFENPIPLIITSDLDSDQISAALKDGFLAIRQPAQDTLFKSNTFDAILFAYGTHHLPVSTRPEAWREAYRLLNDQGRIIVQDFETGTPTEKWYSEVLHLTTKTGHACTHFTANQLRDDLIDSGFKNVEIHYIYDAFILCGDTEEEALVNGIRHIVNLFGMEYLYPESDNRKNWLEIIERLDRYFTIPEYVQLNGEFERKITVRKVGDQYEAEFPRVALVVTGVKIEHNKFIKK